MRCAPWTWWVVLLVLAGCRLGPPPRPEGAPWLTLSRASCFGPCPIYTVEVFEGGHVTWVGERHVAVTGTVEAELRGDQLDALRARVAASGFEGFEKAYLRREEPDQPMVAVKVGERLVRHYLGDRTAPRALVELEEDIDRLVGTARWVKGEAVAP